MKLLFITLLIIIWPLTLYAQDSTVSPYSSKYKILISVDISSIKPTEINDHISTSNTLFETTTKTIKSLPEISATATFRPLQNSNIIILRGGYMWVNRTFQISITETSTSPMPIGTTTGTINETYSVYPLSIGVGMEFPPFGFQWQFEFIYGIGYIKEEGSYTSSIGRQTSYSRTLFSQAYGYRANIQETVRFSNSIGFTLEFGYRGLRFDEYEDEVTTQPSSIEFSCSGIYGSLGLSILL